MTEHHMHVVFFLPITLVMNTVTLERLIYSSLKPRIRHHEYVIIIGIFRQ